MTWHCIAVPGIAVAVRAIERVSARGGRGRGSCKKVRSALSTTSSLTPANTSLTRANTSLTRANTSLTRANTPLTFSNTSLTRANASLTCANTCVTRANTYYVMLHVPATVELGEQCLWADMPLPSKYQYCMHKIYPKQF